MKRSSRLTVSLGLAVGALLALAPSGPAARQAAACDCLRVRAVATGLSSIENPGGTTATLGFNLKATLTCLTGGLPTCSGRLVVQQPLKTPPPTANDVQIVTPASRVIRCSGRCNQATSRTVRLEYRSANDLRFAQRKNERWVFKLTTFCQRGKLSVAGKTVRIEVAFGSSGEFDAANSDLNANGIADGDE